MQRTAGFLDGVIIDSFCSAISRRLEANLLLVREFAGSILAPRVRICAGLTNRYLGIV